ncbi:MAG: DUF4389 domain-containing protein [Gammaproteobacteria bacterium]|nr:DUF4389 domain-containing protein [Gammaproteobacteria bacterium]MDH5801490.1 DUF4389 domain-containing protein [Gammaproteobacteria bacterium]
MATVTTPESTQPEQIQTEPSIWIRGLYMLLFLIVTRLTELVIALIMLVQFVFKAATGSTNANLLTFGDQLSNYLYSIIQFQTFNKEDKPFPFRPWNQEGQAPKQ